MAPAARKGERLAGALARRRRVRRLLVVLGIMAVLATAISLMLPAISMTRGDLVCSLEEHSHSASCYEKVLVCGQEEGEGADPETGEGGHVHAKDCYEKKLVCEVPEHKHSDACYEQAQPDDKADDEGKGDSGDDASDSGKGASDSDKSADDGGAAAADGGDADKGEAPADAADPSASASSASASSAGAVEAGSGSDMPAQSFKADLKDAKGKVTLTVEVEAPEGAFPAGTFMKIDGVDAADIEGAVERAVAKKADGKVTQIQAVDIAFHEGGAEGKEIEPARDITVKLTSALIAENEKPLVVHVDDKGKADVVDTLTKKQLKKRDLKAKDDQLLFDSDKFSTYGIVITSLEQTLEASDGNAYTVTVTAPADAGVPGDARLDARELVEGTDEYDSYCRQAADALGAEPGYARLFDISILDAEGNKIQPDAPVAVEIALDDADGLGDGVKAVHFAGDDGVQVLDASLYGDTVSFDAESFSVYAVIGGTEPTARMQVNFHVISYDSDNQPVDTIVSTVYVKNEDDDDALQMILYDPGVGELDAAKRETFRGWSLNENYTVDEATTEFNDDFENPYGAMTIEDVRNWAKTKQGSIDETNGMVKYDFYAMILKNYQVVYLDRFDVSLDTDSAYMLRNETTSNYTINKNYETNDDDYHFEGWITETEGKISSPNPAPETVTIAVKVPGSDPVQYENKDYKLYANNTKIVLDGDITLKAHAPKGKWLIFHEVEKGATYVAPQFLEEGQEADMPNPNNMHLLGYTFAGWYKGDPIYGEDGVTIVGATPNYNEDHRYNGDAITQKTHVFAKWEPATLAPYTVIIWKQNLDGTYSYAESVKLAGAVDSSIQGLGHLIIEENNDADYLRIDGKQLNSGQTALVNYAKTYKIVHSRTGGGSTNNPYVHHYYTEGTTTESEYVGFNCARIEYEDEKIKPEGTSIVNVYYDRITYTLRIYHARSQNGNYNIAMTRTNETTQTLSPERMNWVNGAVTNGYHGPLPPTEGVYSDTSYANYTYYYTTITAKYGEDISDKWPKYVDYPNERIGNTNYTFVSWYMMNDAAGYRGTGSGLNTFKGVISKMDEKLLGDITRGSDGVNLLVGRYDNREINIYTYKIWKEALLDENGDPIIPDGKDRRVGPDGLTYYLDDSIQANSNAQPSGTQAPTFIGFEIYQTDKPADNNQSGRREDIVCWYHRVKNPIIYRDGSYFDGNGNRLNAYPPQGADVESASIPYETDVSSYNGGYTAAGELVKGDNYKIDYPPSYDGFVFEGWYTDESCTTPYAFTTMPDTSITVYAKFRQVQYRVFLHPNVPDGKTVSWGSDDQAMNFRGTYGQNISLPTGKLIVNEQNPDVLDDSYEFAGWYLDPQYRQPFDADAYVMNDDIASPYDKTVDMTDDMDKYGNIENDSPKPEGTTGPGYNSDLYNYSNETFTLRNRWWVDKKVDLYGKWVKKLETGTGIQVIYDANGGSFSETETIPTYTDTTLYKDATHAVAQSAPVVAPTVTIGDEEKEKVFLYWVLQKWNPDANNGEGAFEDIAPLDFSYPGDSFDVLFANARTVQTTDPDTHEVTKTEYFIQLRAEYTDPEKETPTHIWWYSNFGDNDVIKVNDTSTAQDVEDVRINEAVDIKPENAFTREKYKFLGWARVNSTDEQGSPIADHPKLHPELDEDDLFLRYVEAEGNTPAHFEAQDKEGNWVTVTQVAADEKYPYHDLYAVWEPIYTVTVKKVVVGTDEDKDVAFSFTPAIDGTDEAGFTLKDGQSSEGYTVRPGHTFAVTEAANEDFETALTWTATTDADLVPIPEGEQEPVSVVNGGQITVNSDVLVTVTNTRRSVNLRLYKHDMTETADNPKPLGASFELYEASDVEGGQPKPEASPVAAFATSPEDGLSGIASNVQVGTYYMFETQAPAGYLPLEFPWVLTINMTANYVADITVTENGAHLPNVCEGPDKDNVYTLKIPNNPGKVLPNTGGVGVGILHFLGGIMIIAAAAILLLRRKEHE